jgi:hypothetical protein
MGLDVSIVLLMKPQRIAGILTTVRSKFVRSTPASRKP